MPTVGELPKEDLRAMLLGAGLRIQVGPYVYNLCSPLPTVLDGVATLYRDFPLADRSGFADYHIALRPAGVVQKLRRQLEFYVDDQRPFNRLQQRHAYAFLEWGMNWCVSVLANEYLKLHAAVMSRHGVALVMPGLPGAGKSTLCAAMALNGWRVLSDEHALIIPGTANVVPLPRPVSLKNESIEIVRRLSDTVQLGPEMEDTHKGRVAHMKADLHPDSHLSEPLPARLLLFPQYRAGASTSLGERARAECFMFAAHHSFNYSTLAAVGFDALSTFMDAVQCYDLIYSKLDEALEVLEQLHAGVGR